MAAATQGIDLAALHEQLAEKVEEAAQRLQVPGVAVGILAGDDEDYVFHGVTSVENPLAVNAATLFQIGSTTKTYTGTVMLLLAERGLVDLDAPVRTYVPELRLQDESAARTVTVLQLLNHTAGWAGDVREDSGAGDDARERFLDTLARAEQRSAPGTVASYNNAAVNLAGLVIERVTGKTYEAAVKELVLDPLGLEESWFFPADVMTRRFAVGHREKDGSVTVARPWALPRAGAPAGGITSTAADQIRYARFHLADGRTPSGEQLLDAASVRRMREATASLHGGALGDSVGISWLIRDVDGVRIVAHGGSMNGQQSAFELVPERNFALTVLTNSDSGTLLEKEITEWVFEAYLGITEPEPEQLALDDTERARLVGRYATMHAIVDVTADGDTLILGVTYTDEGLRLVRELLGDVPEVKPIPVRLIPGDRFVVVDGDAKGMKGNILREPEGRVLAINVSGRLAYRAG